MSLSPFRWAVVGTGGIARTVARDMALLPSQIITGVVSRDPVSARAFLDSIGDLADPAARIATRVEELAGDPQFDAAYIATPHPWHHAQAGAFIDGKTPVLVEKPCGMTAAETADLVARAGTNQVFLMEAMWTRCLPLMRQVLDLVKAGTIGEVRLVQADFCFNAPYSPTSRLYAPELGGGALLDVGVYVLHFANAVYGRSPDRLSATSVTSPLGTDAITSIAATWNGQGNASLSCAVAVATRQDAIIYGTKGRITIPSFWRASSARIEVDGQPAQDLHAAHPGGGYQFELAEVERCVRAGLLESPLVPWASSVAVAGDLDRALARG